jgi:hypothetical protein
LDHPKDEELATREKLGVSFLPISLNNNVLSGETPDTSELVELDARKELQQIDRQTNFGQQKSFYFYEYIPSYFFMYE